MMVKNRKAIVKSDATVWKLQIIHRFGSQPGFDKILQVIPPIAKTATQREGKINIVNQFVTGNQLVQNIPRVSILYTNVVAGAGFATTAPSA